MKVDAGRGKLYDAQKVLRHRWDEVSEKWTDNIRDEFKEKCGSRSTSTLPTGYGRSTGWPRS